MSRKDFELIAAAIRRTRETTDNPMAQAVLSTLAVTLAADLATTNERFNCTKFVEACAK